MKPIILYFLFVCCSFNLFAQYETESVDCIILVDGKLVQSIGGYIAYHDSVGQMKHISFGYWRGKILFKKEEKQSLYSLADTTPVFLHLIYVDHWIDKLNGDIFSKTYEYEYPYPIRISSLPTKNDNICSLFSITNFNKKKGIYYFNFVSDNGRVRKWEWKPEYGNRKKAHKKVYSAYENASFYEKRYRPRD